jgi:hypothetical protein
MPVIVLTMKGFLAIVIGIVIAKALDGRRGRSGFQVTGKGHAFDQVNGVVSDSRADAGDDKSAVHVQAAELRFYGIDLLDTVGKWTQKYVENLGKFRLEDRFMQESFNFLLEQLSGPVRKLAILTGDEAGRTFRLRNRPGFLSPCFTSRMRSPFASRSLYFF